MSRTRVFEVKLLIETDDETAVDTFAEAITKLACSMGDFEDHTCPLPWFVMTSELDDQQADEVRELLNR
jgi:UDP-N-acetylglucosamine pyrophosphorylase